MGKTSNQKIQVPVWQRFLSNVSRFLLAFTFVFSGFIKANDPYGTAYKIQDYVVSFGLDTFPMITLLVAAVILALIEFSLGIQLLVGISRKQVSFLTFLFMLVMTLLTVYIYLFDPVSDCGCFGDVIILSNGETLLKNIVLLSAAIIYLKYSEQTIRLMGPNTQWLISLFGTTYILTFGMYTMRSLPIFDFRPYKIGTDLRVSMEHGQEYDTRIIYSRGDEVLELSIDDDDPDSTWTYVETRTTPIGNATDRPNMMVTDLATDDDVTDDIVYADGYTFIVTIPDLQDADESCIDLINEIHEYSLKNRYGFYCLTASADSLSQAYWSDHTGAEYGYYISDERELKTMVRSIPGVLLLKDGVIINKWSSSDIPDEYVLTDRLENLSIGELRTEDTRKKMLSVLIYFLFPLMIVFIADRIGSGFAFYRELKRKSEVLKLDEIEKKITMELKNENKNKKTNIH